MDSQVLAETTGRAAATSTARSALRVRVDAGCAARLAPAEPSGPARAESAPLAVIAASLAASVCQLTIWPPRRPAYPAAIRDRWGALLTMDPAASRMSRPTAVAEAVIRENYQSTSASDANRAL